MTLHDGIWKQQRFKIGEQARINDANVLAVSIAGQPYYASDTFLMYIFDGTRNRRVTEPTVVSKTAAYTIVESDDIVLVDTTGGAVTITLPDAAAQVGRFTVKDSGGSAGTNNITVDTDGGNIDGAATYPISTNYGKSTFVSDGTDWFAI